MLLRPYDGGPIAAMNTISYNYFNSFDSKSNQPLLSIHYLNNSIGGYAP